MKKLESLKNSLFTEQLEKKELTMVKGGYANPTSSTTQHATGKGDSTQTWDTSIKFD